MMTEDFDPGAVLADDGFVSGIARAMLGETHAAEDVLQDARLAALTRKSEPASMRAWLAGVAKNLSRRSRRTSRRRDARERLVARPERVSSAADMVEREEWRRTVVEELLGLEEPYRTTLILRFYRDLAPRAIAVETGEAAATVRSRLSRGLAILKKNLERRCGIDRSAWGLGLLAGHIPGVSGSAATTAVSKWFVETLVVSSKAKTALALALIVVVGIGIRMKFFGADAPLKPEAAAEPATAAVGDAAVRRRTAAGEAGEAGAEPAAAPKAEPVAAQPANEPSRANRNGSFLLTVLWGDGTPAADTAIHWARKDGRSPDLGRWYRTDADGKVLIASAAPGSHVVQGVLGGYLDANVPVGGRGTATLKMLDNPAVTGIVTDPEGRPVAGADVRLGYSDWQGAVVARTGKDGRYVIRSVDLTVARVLSAVGGGYASGPAIELRDDSPAGRVANLTVGPRGARVHGVVRDPAGARVAHATVRIGPEMPRMLQLPDGSRGWNPPPMEIVTGDDGAFECDTVNPGMNLIRAHARGFTPARAEVDVSADRSTSVTLDLTSGARISGRVTRAGAPAADIVVEFGGFGTPEFMRTTTGADGRYRFDGAAAGNRPIGVRKNMRDLTNHAMLTLRPNEELTHDITIIDGGRINGVVIDNEKKPLGGYIVILKMNTDRRSAVTDAEGRFMFDGVEAEVCDLEVSVLGKAVLQHIADRRGVAVGQTVEIIIEKARVAAANVSGIVRDAADRPLAGAVASLVRTGDIMPQQSTTDADGRFEFKGVVQGEISVVVTKTGFAEYSAPPRLFAGDLPLDLGDIHLTVGTVTTINVATETGEQPSRLVVIVRPADDRAPAFRTVAMNAGTGETPPLAAGTYEVLCHAEGYASASARLVVGETPPPPVNLRLVRGALISVHVQASAGSAPIVRATVTIDADSPAPLAETFAAVDGRLPSFGFALAPGVHRIRAVATDGRRGEATVRIVKADDPEHSVEIVLM